MTIKLPLDAVPPPRRSGTPRPPLSMHGAAVLGLAAMMSAVGGFGLWAATAPLASAVVAPGHVIVASKRKQIQHLEGGIVHSIAVKDGDHVESGDVLIELDTSVADGRLAVSQGAYLAGMILEARLLAERDELPVLEFPAAVQTELQSNPKIGELVLGQRQIFAARQAELVGQSTMLTDRIARLGEQSEALTAQREATNEQLDVAEQEHETLEALLAKGFTTRTRVLGLKREIIQLHGELGRLDAQDAQIRKDEGDARAQLQQLRKEFKTKVLAELREVQAKMIELKEQFEAAKVQEQRSVLRAPVSGFVVASQLHTVGGVVRPGETLLEIVPDADSLLVEARVRPQDIDEVHLSQPSEVKFTAFKQRITPLLIGRVVYVSADALADTRTGESYYIAQVEVGHEELAKLEGQRLQAGMPSEVMIKTGERTALAYLVQPLMDSMHRAWREQ